MSRPGNIDYSDLPQPPVQVIYSGRVQGVGFRWTCRSIAKRHPVTGTVRNLSNGSVELFADGSDQDVRSFLTEIHRTMEGNINLADIRSAADTGPFADFRILH